MRKIILLFLVFGLCSHADAYFDFNKRLEKAYHSILTLRFDEAQALIAKEKAEKPGNDLSLLYENYIDFLKAFISEEKKSFITLKQNATHRLDVLTDNNKEQSSPFLLYSLAEINIQLALVRVKFEENVLAAAEIRKAYKLIERNKTLYPEFELNNKVAGFLHAMVGAVPAKYNWVVNLAGMNGNITLGLKELESCYDIVGKGVYSSYQMEILFYLGTIYSVFATPGENIPLLETMKNMAAESPLIAYVYSNTMMKRGGNDESIRVLDIALGLKNVYPFTFLYYKRGLCKLRKLDLAAANDFRLFLINYSGVNNIKSAYQKLGWIGLLSNDTLSYNRYMQSCLTNGHALLDEDRDAQHEALSKEKSNPILLRSRLYFDGGYYQKSLAELTGHTINDFPRFRDQLEITYRLGRIMHMLGNFEKAIHNYEVTINNGSASPWHYAANSALMLGSIYEDKNDYEKALKYYQMCLSMDFEQYKNSIDQKARASIDRVKDKMEKK